MPPPPDSDGESESEVEDAEEERVELGESDEEPDAEADADAGDELLSCRGTMPGTLSGSARMDVGAKRRRVVKIALMLRCG